MNTVRPLNHDRVELLNQLYAREHELVQALGACARTCTPVYTYGYDLAHVQQHIALLEEVGS